MERAPATDQLQDNGVASEVHRSKDPSGKNHHETLVISKAGQKTMSPITPRAVH